MPKRPDPRDIDDERTPRQRLVAPTNGQAHESTSGQANVPTFSARGVDPAVAERARVYKARHKRLTMGQIVTEALTLYLDQNEATP